MHGPQLDTPRFFRLLGSSDKELRNNWTRFIAVHGDDAFIAAKHHLDRRAFADFVFHHLDQEHILRMLHEFAAGGLCGPIHWPVVWKVLEHWLKLRTIPEPLFTEHWPVLLKGWERLGQPLQAQMRTWIQELIHWAGSECRIGWGSGNAMPLHDRLWWLGDPRRRTILAACLGEIRFSWTVDAGLELTRVRHNLAVGFPIGFTLALRFTADLHGAPRSVAAEGPVFDLFRFTDGLKQPPARILAEDVFGSAQWQSGLGIVISVDVPALENLGKVDVVDATILAILHLFAHSILRTVPDAEGRLVPRLDAALEDRLVQTILFRSIAKRCPGTFGAFCFALPPNYHLDDLDRLETLGEIQAFLLERRIRPSELRARATRKLGGATPGKEAPNA